MYFQETYQSCTLNILISLIIHFGIIGSYLIKYSFKSLFSYTLICVFTLKIDDY